jgi:hypothetical protein
MRPGRADDELERILIRQRMILEQLRLRVLRLSPSLLGKLDFEFSFALRQNQDFQLAPSTKPTTAPSANIAIGWLDRLVDCAFEITCDLLHVLSGLRDSETLLCSPCPGRGRPPCRPTRLLCLSSQARAQVLSSKHHVMGHCTP